MNMKGRKSVQIFFSAQWAKNLSVRLVTVVMANIFCNKCLNLIQRSQKAMFQAKGTPFHAC